MKGRPITPEVVARVKKAAAGLEGRRDAIAVLAERFPLSRATLKWIVDGKYDGGAGCSSRSGADCAI